MTDTEQALVREARSHSFVIDHVPEMIQAFASAKLFASTRLFMLLRGETGTGKEPLARAIHAMRHEGRTDGKFRSVNCAALSESLLDSELFGHERGAFTDARERRIGKFEEVSNNKGVLFLDEIGDTQAIFQSKLLRVLDHFTITRVGSNEEIDVSQAKIVAATHQDLKHLIQKGLFSQALYGRMAACEIKLPPLRGRDERHIFALVDHLVANIEDTPVPAAIEDGAKHELLRYSFPENVRQLKHLLTRAYWSAYAENQQEPCISCEHIQHCAGQLPTEYCDESGRRHAEYSDGNLAVTYSSDGIPYIDVRVRMDCPLEQTVDLLKMLCAREQVRRCDGRQALAANALGLSRLTLRTYLRKTNDLEGEFRKVMVEKHSENNHNGDEP